MSLSERKAEELKELQEEAFVDLGVARETLSRLLEKLGPDTTEHLFSTPFKMSLNELRAELERVEDLLDPAWDDD